MCLLSPSVRNTTSTLAHEQTQTLMTAPSSLNPVCGDGLLKEARNLSGVLKSDGLGLCGTELLERQTATRETNYVWNILGDKRWKRLTG